MFRPRPEGPDPAVAVSVEGRTVMVPVGTSAAAAVLAAGFDSIRETPVGERERGPYCMMGVCFDCLAEIDGAANQRSCMIEVQPGMRISRQIRARTIDPGAG